MSAARRRLGGGSFDWLVLGLTALMVAGAYFDAHGRVATVSGTGTLGPWQEAVAHAGWLAVTLLFAGTLAWNVSRGAPLASALPAGYEPSLLAALVLGMADVAGGYVQAAVGPAQGLDALLTPTRLLEIGAGVVIAAGPLRAALRRGEEPLEATALVSAALVLAVLAFTTQFAHPLVDPWAAGNRRPETGTWWVMQDLGVAGLLLQTALVTAMVLFLVRQFRVRAGSATLLLLVYGILSASLKLRYQLLLVPLAVGLAADVLIWRLQPFGSRVRQQRVLGAAVPLVYTTSYFAVLFVAGGVWWTFHAWAGSILAATGSGLLLSQLVTGPRRLASALPTAPPGGVVRWPLHEPELTAGDVKVALEHLNEPDELSRSPLLRMRALSSGEGDGVADLRGLLNDVVRELASSSSARDAEAGRLLLDYYIKRVGSHDLIAERLRLSRPTFYRRLQRGLVLVAERLDELGEFAATVPPPE